MGYTLDRATFQLVGKRGGAKKLGRGKVMKKGRNGDEK